MGCPADDRGHVGDCGCDCRRTGPRPLSGRHACRRVIGNVLNHVVETRIVLYARYGEEAVGEFDAMLDGAGIDVVPFDGALARAAFDGFRRYGKGQGHPAQLNIIAPPMRWRKPATNRCYSRAMTSCGPTSNRRFEPS
jgi:hypothetical protein